LPWSRDRELRISLGAASHTGKKPGPAPPAAPTNCRAPAGAHNDQKKIRWKGELARPIRPAVIRPLGMSVIDPATIEHVNDTMVRLHEEEVERHFDRLLMDHYSISDTGDWRGLALKLAADLIPGFRVEPPIGSCSY
jgi:hypothetical protein